MYKDFIKYICSVNAKFNVLNSRHSVKNIRFFSNTKSTVNDFGFDNVEECFVPGITADPFFKDITIPKRCIGCGSAFQTTDATKPGYILPEILNESGVRGTAKLPRIRGIEVENAPEGVEVIKSDSGKFSTKRRRIVCVRCYKLQNYKRIDSHSEVEAQRKNLAIELLKSNENISRDAIHRPLSSLNVKVKGVLQTPQEEDASAARRSLRILSSAEIISDMAMRINNNSLVLFIVDLTNLEASVIPELYIALRNKALDVIWIANKLDILPKGAEPTSIKSWLRSISRHIGNAKSGDVILVSSTKGIGFTTIENRMKEYIKIGNPRNIYTVGATNVGKSTFVNRFLDFINYKDVGTLNLKRGVGGVTRSAIPGTTLEFVEFGLPNKFKLIDTPGVPIIAQMTSLLYKPADLLSISLTKTINPLSIKLEDSKSLLIGGIARIDLIEGSSAIVQCFISNGVTIKICRTVSATDIMKKQVGTKLFPPHDKNDYEKIQYSKYRINISCNGMKPIDEFVIPGLGWLSFCGNGPKIVEFYIPKGINFLRRPAMITNKPRGIDGYNIYHGRGRMKRIMKLRSEMMESPIGEIN